MRHLTLSPDLGPVTSTALTVRSPYSGAVLATAQTLDLDGLKRALAHAHRQHHDPACTLTPAQRITIFERASTLLADDAERIALEASQEGGKPLADSRVEVARAVDGLRWCAQAVRSVSGSVIPMDLNSAAQGRMAFTELAPIGPVLAYSAFNHPVNLVVHQVGTALAAGCPVVIKPAEKTPISCHHVARVLHEAGLPEGWLHVVHAECLEDATALVSDPRIAFFSFIGSARVGWSLRRRLAAGTRCALEHGGMAPVIVAEDADLEDIVPRLARGAFYHAGQVCVSVQRIYAARSIASRLGDALSDAAQKLCVGDPTDPNTDIGPIINEAERQRIHRAVCDSGAQVLCGGKPMDANAYAPTVLMAPDPEASVQQEELFGPVVSITPVDDLDEAIELANARPFPFQAAVCSSAIDTCLYVARRLAATCVMVNDHTAFRVDWMPFGGHGQAGLGVGGMAYAMREQSIEKQIVMRSPLLETPS
jgi:acyl-CoA reductase-like NAD-dependent aldehyde dehydrogenase